MPVQFWDWEVMDIEFLKEDVLSLLAFFAGIGCFVVPCKGLVNN
jgi:hypothetical protein